MDKNMVQHPCDNVTIVIIYIKVDKIVFCAIIKLKIQSYLSCITIDMENVDILKICH